MPEVSMLEFRRDAKRVLDRVTKVERFVLTHRGKPIARLEPICDTSPAADDPFYSLCELAEPMGSLTNREIDQIVYGQ